MILQVDFALTGVTNEKQTCTCYKNKANLLL